MEPQVIKSIRKIAAFMDVSKTTMMRWIAKEQFPAGQLPNGLWVTTPNLIQNWIVARGKLLDAPETIKNSPKNNEYNCNERATSST